MRILHVTDTYAPTVGGIEALVAGMALAQVAAGHRVSVLTSTPGPDPGVRSPLLVSRAPHRMEELIDGADVVHAHVSAYSPLAVRAAVRAASQGLPVLAEVHSVWGSAWPLISAWTRARGCRRLPVQWAAVSRLAAGFVTRAVRPPAPVLVVPNAIDTAAWAPRPPTRSPDVITVVSTMRMTGRKRPLPLLRMLRAVRAGMPAGVRLRAVLVGDGPQLPIVRRFVARHDMAWVSLPGALAQDRLREVYAGADLYVAPAVMESFGLAALEARASGLPVVAMARSGLADVLEHGVDSLLVADDVDMAAAITRLVRDTPARLALAAHCRTIAPAADWSHVLTNVFSGYDAAHVLARAGSRADVRCSLPAIAGYGES